MPSICSGTSSLRDFGVGSGDDDEAPRTALAGKRRFEAKLRGAIQLLSLFGRDLFREVTKDDDPLVFDIQVGVRVVRLLLLRRVGDDAVTGENERRLFKFAGAGK